MNELIDNNAYRFITKWINWILFIQVTIWTHKSNHIQSKFMNSVENDFLGKI